MHDPIITFLHIAIGSIGIIGGLVSLISLKGGPAHKRAGWVFIFGMVVSIITTFIFMTNEFLPLAIVMCIASIYLMVSSISAVRNRQSWSKVTDYLLLIFPLALFLFPSSNIIRSLPNVSMVTVGQSLISLIFLYCLVDDILYLRNKQSRKVAHIGRHLFKMILAFTFAIMAVFRIGVKVDIINLEYTVIVPLIVGFIIAYRLKTGTPAIQIT